MVSTHIAYIAVVIASAHGFYLKPIGGVNASDVLHLFPNATTKGLGAKKLDEAFNQAFKAFEKRSGMCTELRVITWLLFRFDFEDCC